MTGWRGGRCGDDANSCDCVNYPRDAVDPLQEYKVSYYSKEMKIKNS